MDKREVLRIVKNAQIKSRGQQFWEKQIEVQEEYEEQFKKKIIPIFKRQEKNVIDRLQGKKRANVDVPAVLLDPVTERAEFKESFENLVSNIIEAEGNIAMDLVGVRADIDMENPKVRHYLKQNIIKFSDSVNETTNDQIRSTLADGLDKGEGIPKLTRRIGSVFTQARRYRSEAVARTESARAMGFATEEAYTQSGVVEAKEWLTAFDERTCFPKNTKVLTREGEKNIQDIKAGELVKTPKGYQKVLRTFQREYDAVFVGIRVNNKNIIATENHPVWTKKGWKRMDELVVGDLLKTVKNELVDIVGIIHFRFFQANSFPTILFQGGVTTDIFPSIRMPESSVVYNLEVENENVYYANGLLVHNCMYCASMNGKVVEINRNFFEKGDEFLGLSFDYEAVGYPPLHVNCRCTLIPKIIEAPGGRRKPTEEAEEVEWKPSMSRDEAERWARNSEVTDDLYHGTPSTETIDNINNEGFNLGDSGIYGKGVYLAKDRKLALKYTGGVGESNLMSCKVNINKLKIFEDSDDFYKASEKYFENYLERVKGDFKKTIEAKAKGILKMYNEHLMRKYDALRIKKSFNDSDEILIFDPKKVTNITE